MTGPHQAWREQLGSYALGHLDSPASDAVRAHVDGCASCRAELDELAPLGALLAQVDPAHLDVPLTPPGDLGGRIRDGVAGERELRDARRARERGERHRRGALTRRTRIAVVAAVLLAGLSGGALLDRLSRTDQAPARTVPMESVALRPVAGSGVTIDSATLVAHTWGVELRMSGEGFAAGHVYFAAFRERDGDFVPAGEFIGTGASEVTCNLQSGVMRADTVGVEITDQSGSPVARTRW